MPMTIPFLSCSIPTLPPAESRRAKRWPSAARSTGTDLMPLARDRRDGHRAAGIGSGSARGRDPVRPWRLLAGPAGVAAADSGPLPVDHATPKRSIPGACPAPSVRPQRVSGVGGRRSLRDRAAASRRPPPVAPSLVFRPAAAAAATAFLRSSRRIDPSSIAPDHGRVSEKGGDRPIGSVRRAHEGRSDDVRATPIPRASPRRTRRRMEPVPHPGLHPPAPPVEAIP